MILLDPNNSLKCVQLHHDSFGLSYPSAIAYTCANDLWNFLLTHPLAKLYQSNPNCIIAFYVDIYPNPTQEDVLLESLFTKTLGYPKLKIWDNTKNINTTVPPHIRVEIDLTYRFSQICITHDDFASFNLVRKAYYTTNLSNELYDRLLNASSYRTHQPMEVEVFIVEDIP